MRKINTNNNAARIIGCLMKEPSLLSKKDVYSLSIQDFPEMYWRYIFDTIGNLYYKGSNKIEVIDIENALFGNKNSKQIYESNNCHQLLFESLELGEVVNFNTYYTELKRDNALNDLIKMGVDISQFYCEDMSNPKYNEIQNRYQTLTPKIIFEELKTDILKLQNTYAEGETGKTICAVEGIRDLLESSRNGENVGVPIQGKYNTLVMSGARQGAFMLRSAASGTGKALPNSTIIPTPSGWKRVDEIKVGDYLFDAFGKPTKVLGAYPQGEKDVWFVKFKDGRVAKCCEEHLWSYCKVGQETESKKNREFYTSTLSKLKNEKLQDSNGDNIYLVPNNYAVEYSHKEYCLSPYILGLVLGDDSLREQYHWNLELNFKPEDKFIPQEYLFGDIQQRFSLLNGLLDMSGSVDKSGNINYFTISSKLKDNFIELTRSLGFKTSVAVDIHRNLYVIHLTGRPEDKIKLFKSQPKRERLEHWYNNVKKKESNEFNSIVEIGSCGYREEMTCFYVDNSEHLFLMNDFIVTHNTRNMVADSCFLAYPVRYNSAAGQWEAKGCNEKVLYIPTEQENREIQLMILAYLSDINESKIRAGLLTADEEKVINQAINVMETYKDNLFIRQIPEPSNEVVKNVIREECILHNIGYVFYDYVFIGSALINEFKGTSMRHDEILLLLTTTLKDLAVELNVFIMSATQLNASGDDNKNIKNEAALAGGRSQINKADIGFIMSRPTNEEINFLSSTGKHQGRMPNLVTDVYKVRSGEFTQVRIWSYFDYGTLKKEDFYITDSQFNIIEIDKAQQIEYENWESPDILQVAEKLNSELR